jgi:hypothetical protein
MHTLTLVILGEPFEIIYDASMVGNGVIILQKCKLIFFKIKSYLMLKRIIPLEIKKL